MVMIWVTLYGGAIISAPYYSSGRAWTIFDYIAWWFSRIGTLFFIATITTATLSTTGFKKKDLMYKVSIYLFTISMILLFVNVLAWLFRF
mgnify:CR=1 FL=1